MCFDFSNCGIIRGGLYTKCWGGFIDHGMTRGGLYPGYKSPLKIGTQTKKK